MPPTPLLKSPQPERHGRAGKQEMGRHGARLPRRHLLQARPRRPHGRRALRVQVLVSSFRRSQLPASARLPPTGPQTVESVRQEIRLPVLHPPIHLLRLPQVRRGQQPPLCFRAPLLPALPPSMEVLSLASKECPGLKVLGLPRISVDDESQFLNLITNWKDFELLEMDSKPAKLTEIMKLIDLHCKNFGGLKLRGWISRDEALGIADSLPKLRFLDLSGSHLSKEEILIIVDGCRELKKLKVNDCVGFEGEDEELKKRRATAMDVFEHEGCVIGDDSLHHNHDDSDADLDLQFTYFDYCFETWMF
ncbi:F-box protein SKIP19 [Platanthera zijinensis]|uniref:F-box protein SKIP19 n=1 Tax=Platanthera zijinensis TaxID=2320716 RepID=A0AAP0GE47_9ASPA